MIVFGQVVCGGDVVVYGGVFIMFILFVLNFDNLKNFYEIGLISINNLVVGVVSEWGNYCLLFIDMWSNFIIFGVNFDC